MSKQKLDYYSDEAREKRRMHDGMLYGSILGFYGGIIFAACLLVIS